MYMDLKNYTSAGAKILVVLKLLVLVTFIHSWSLMNVAFYWSISGWVQIFQISPASTSDIIRPSIFTPSLSIFHFWRVMNAAYFLSSSSCQTNYQRMKFNLGMERLQGPRATALSAQKQHILKLLTKCHNSFFSSLSYMVYNYSRRNSNYSQIPKVWSGVM